MNDKFVTTKAFDFELENVKFKLEDSKDYQVGINDAFGDKFE